VVLAGKLAVAVELWRLSETVANELGPELGERALAGERAAQLGRKAGSNTDKRDKDDYLG